MDVSETTVNRQSVTDEDPQTGTSTQNMDVSETSDSREPMTDEEPQPGTSTSNKQLDYRLSRNPIWRIIYHEALEEMLVEGVVEEVPACELAARLSL